MPIPVAAWLKA